MAHKRGSPYVSRAPLPNIEEDSPMAISEHQHYHHQFQQQQEQQQQQQHNHHHTHQYSNHHRHQLQYPPPDCDTTFQPPETPLEPMEFLSRSWSISALKIANALAPFSACSDTRKKGSGSALDSEEQAIDAPASAPFRFPTVSTAHLVMECISAHQSDLSPASKRKSHSSITSGNVVANCPVSPPWQGDELMFCRSFSGVRNPLRDISLRRWLKDLRERKREVNRAHSAQIHAAISVAGVAAAIAAIAAATATSATATSAANEDIQSKTSMAVASAAALVAAQCVDVAESIGADRDQMAAIISSAVNVKLPGDVMTLTAAAATALRGAAVLNARVLRDTESIRSHNPCDSGDDNNSLINSVRDSPSDDSEVECGNLEFLNRGCEFLKRTRKGDVHWRIVSVYLDKNSQVVVKSQSKYMGAAMIKNRKRFVIGVYTDIPCSWESGSHDGGERRWHFGIKTDQGVMELQCKNEAQHRLWTEGISHLLSVSKHKENI